MWQLLKQLRRGGLPMEARPEQEQAWRVEASRIQARIVEMLGRALAIREVDPGSCNGCELEIQALNNPYYNLEGYGIRFVASPRHADMLLVTGPVSRHMAEALRRTCDATPDPKLVVAVGDCGCTGGVFGCSYASCGAVSAVIGVDVAVPGCPPAPVDILRGILTAVEIRGATLTQQPAADRPS